MIDKIVHNVPELNSSHEKADMRLVLPVTQAAEAGAKRLVVLSADTDILVLMLYNWSELERKGLNELWFLWFQAIERCIPIQKLALKLGADFCKVIPAVHALTGCDYSSKAGTKAADFGYIMEDDLLLPSNIITQLPENMSATANTVLLDGVIIGNYQSVAPNSANVWMKQKSLLNAKIHTQSISNFKRY